MKLQTMVPQTKSPEPVRAFLFFLASIGMAFGQAYTPTGMLSSPYGHASGVEFLFPGLTGRSDLIPAARESGLYAAYGIIGVPGQIAMLPKVQGSVRMVGGGLEALTGGYFTYQTGGIGGWLGGGALAGNGLDNFYAGLNTFNSNSYEQAFLEQAFTRTLGNGVVGNGGYALSQLAAGGLPFGAMRLNSLFRVPSLPFEIPVPQTTILGENMFSRVMPYADATGTTTLGFGATPEAWALMNPYQRYRLNDGMLRARIAAGSDFRFIGTDPLRPPSARLKFDLTGSELLRLDERGIPYDIVDPVNVYEVLGVPDEVLGR